MTRFTRSRAASGVAPRTDSVPCGRDDGYYRWGIMEVAIDLWDFVARA